MVARLDMDDINDINEDDKPSWYSYISNYIYTLLLQIKK